MTNTPNLNLNKPAQTDYFNVEHFNDNADILDEAVGTLQKDIKSLKEADTKLEEKIQTLSNGMIHTDENGMFYVMVEE